MTDLTDYDREIVAAATDCSYGNALFNWHQIEQAMGSSRTKALRDLFRAVQAKRDAQRPRCGFRDCDAPATQNVAGVWGHANDDFSRCNEHHIEVREL